MEASCNAVVLVFDRLGAGFLGPYGATWIDTPAFNQLASQSLLCEQLWLDAPGLAHVYRGYAEARHVLQTPADAPNLFARLRQQPGFQSHLVTDDANLAQLLEPQFTHTRRLSHDAKPAVADAPEQTRLARLFATGMETLDRLRSPFLLWLHAGALGEAWDAPHELRQRFVGEEDPELPPVVAPPSLLMDGNADPDYLFGLQQCYAAQVALADMALGALLDGLAEHPAAANTLLAVTSCGGFPLGEHAAVGAAAAGLYGELLHVPLLLRYPQGLAAARRTQTLLQPADFGATLAEWFGISLSSGASGQSLGPLARGEIEVVRDRVLSASGGERALRTPAWFARFPTADEASQETPSTELFAQPDDYWQVNNVATRCPHVVEEMLAVARQEEAALAGDVPHASAALPALLAVGQD